MTSKIAMTSKIVRAANRLGLRGRLNRQAQRDLDAADRRLRKLG